MSQSFMFHIFINFATFIIAIQIRNSHFATFIIKILGKNCNNLCRKSLSCNNLCPQ